MREGTRRSHHQLDSHPALSGLLKADSLGHYADCLQTFAQAWLPFETTAESIQASEPKLGPFFLRRSSALQHDLAQLGRTALTSPALACEPPGGWPGRLAWFYVLNGAQLGAAMLERQILARIPEAPVRFFAARQSHPDSNWHAFCRFLDDQPLTQTDLDAAVAEANRAFSNLLERLPAPSDCRQPITG